MIASAFIRVFPTCFAIFSLSKFRNAEIFDASITAVSYKDQKIITQESRREELDYDPSEGQDWNWEDYE